MNVLAPTQPALLECCASRAWAAAVDAKGPYAGLDELINSAREVWWHQVRRRCRRRPMPFGRQQPSTQCSLPLCA